MGPDPPEQVCMINHLTTGPPALLHTKVHARLDATVCVAEVRNPTLCIQMPSRCWKRFSVVSPTGVIRPTGTGTGTGTGTDVTGNSPVTVGNIVYKNVSNI